MMNKLSAIKATAIVLNHGYEPFFAKDLGLTSGDINTLAGSLYFIRPTGNTREEFINVYDNHFLRVTAKEWELTDKWQTKWMQKEIAESVKEVLDLADMLRNMGI